MLDILGVKWLPLVCLGAAFWDQAHDRQACLPAQRTPDRRAGYDGADLIVFRAMAGRARRTMG